MIHHKAIFLDLDGTVYRASEPCSNAVRSINDLVDTDKHIRYLTNNSAARPEVVAKKLNEMGIPCEPSWVYSSASVTARYCQSHGFKTAFVVGQPELTLTLKDAGLIISEHRPDAVIVGICRHFHYDLMNQAMQYIRDGATFIATNPDPTYPIEGGQFVPGAGSIVSAIKTCSEQEPIVIGKPSPTMALSVCHDLGIQPQDALLVGDRLDTDIACGKSAGCDTWLVLTGVEQIIPDGQLGSQDLSGLL